MSDKCNLPTSLPRAFVPQDVHGEDRPFAALGPDLLAQRNPSCPSVDRPMVATWARLVKICLEDERLPCGLYTFCYPVMWYNPLV
jgi:hypothetical protein